MKKLAYLAPPNLLGVALASLAFAACATVGGGSPTGSEEKPDDSSQKLMEEVGGKAKGIIVWSSSRLGNHDLFVMNTDGSNVHAITHGDAVDWFPRFSPDGSKILFTRSKKGWVFERDANTDGKWDIYTVSPDGKDETKVVENASWGTWISNDEIVFARSTAIVRRKLGGDQETVLVDSTKVRELDGALLQQPEMSKDENLGADRRGLPDQLEPVGRGGLLGASDRQRRQPRAAHPDQGREGREERRGHRRADTDRYSGPSLARVLPAALFRRKVAGLGGDAARARSRYRRLRDLSVGGRLRAGESRPTDLAFGQ
jgi:hypothetical protein